MDCQAEKILFFQKKKKERKKLCSVRNPKKVATGWILFQIFVSLFSPKDFSKSGNVSAAFINSLQLIFKVLLNID